MHQRSYTGRRNPWFGTVLIAALAVPVMANPPGQPEAARSATGTSVGQVLRTFTRVAKAGMAMLLLAGDPLAEATAARGLQLPDTCPVPPRDGGWGLNPVSFAPVDGAGGKPEGKREVAAPPTVLAVTLPHPACTQFKAVVTEGNVMRASNGAGIFLAFRAAAKPEAEGFLDYFDPASGLRFRGEVSEVLILAHPTPDLSPRIQFSGASVDGDGVRFLCTVEGAATGGWPATLIGLRIWGGAQDVDLAPEELAHGYVNRQWKAREEPCLSGERE